MAWNRDRPLTLAVIIGLCALISLFLLYSWNGDQVITDHAHTSHKKHFAAPRHNVWAELSAQEADEVNTFLLKDLAFLNLTTKPKGTRDNYIYYVETLRPNKTDALSYLHRNVQPPQRWAKAIISEFREDGPYMSHYMVQLPITHQSRALPLTYVFNSGTNALRMPVMDLGLIINCSVAALANISDITQELLGATANPDNPNDPDGLGVWPRPSSIDRGRQTAWVQIVRPGLRSGGRSLLAQGIYFKMNMTSLDVSEWDVEQYYYNGILYASADEFRAAIKEPGFFQTPRNEDGPWTDTEDFESEPAGRELPPPVMVQPYGPRYRLDREEQFVSWFGFEFYITTAQATGVSLYDIRFKGERVLYELGLQEALSHYAGDDPQQGGLEYLDTFLGMGKMMFELLPGYDCPAYADYLDVPWHQLYETNTLPNSICIFEYTADHLLSRHSAQYTVTASRNTYLVLRSVSTVGNYDYTVEYIFYMDGSLEVKVRASGFIIGAFYTANSTKQEDEYGHRIHEALSSSMHDHVINFKADFDVAGTRNDFVRLGVEPLTASYPWDKPELEERNTMHLVEHAVTEETALDWPRNAGEMYVVYSAEQRNAWGERKGYRITSGTGIASTPHLTIVNSTVLADASRWAEHDVWVLRRKDTEPRSADPLNYFSPHEPMINFNKMADHESLVHGGDDDDNSSYDGDLVVYFNVGSHHVPHSGDLPNTLMHTSASSAIFVPHNFNDRDPSRESVQGVRLQMNGPNSGGFAGQLGTDDLKTRQSARSVGDKKQQQPEAKYFGATYEKGVQVSLDAVEPDLLRQYRSKEHRVTDLSFNGSAAGIWLP